MSQLRLKIDQRNVAFGYVVTTHWTGRINSIHSTAKKKKKKKKKKKTEKSKNNANGTSL